MKKYVVSVLMLMSFSAVGAHAATVDFPCVNKDGVPIPCFFRYATSVDIERLGNHVDVVNKSIKDTADRLNKTLVDGQTKITHLYQDMKNYMSLQQIEKTKADAQLLFQAPPFSGKTQSNGQFELDLKNQSEIMKAYYTHDAFSRDMLSTTADVNADIVVNNHLKNYCSISEARQKLCTSTSTDQSDEALKKDVPQDLNAESLFKTTYKNPNEQVAADAYLRNLTNPVPVPLLTPDQMFLNQKDHVLSEAGRRNLLALYRQQAMMSLAQQSLITSLTDRLQFDNKDDQGKTLQTKSRNELIANEAGRRFNNTDDWYQQMNTLSTQGLLREIANMMALQLTMHERDSERLERIEVLMSSQVAYMAQVIGTEEKAQQAVDKFNLKKEAEQKAGMTAGK